jgi:hypothetical protein
LIAANERVWLTEGNEFHLVEALAQLVESFTLRPQMVSSVDRYVELQSLFNLYCWIIVVLNHCVLQASKWDYNFGVMVLENTTLGQLNSMHMTF